MQSRISRSTLVLTAFFALVLTTGCVGHHGSKGLTVVNTPAFEPVANQMHFSQGVKAGGFLFCSGMLGVTAEGVLPDDLETEFRTAFRNIEALLAEAGLTFADVVDIMTLHVDDPKYSDEETNGLFMKVHDEFMQAPWSTWTGIGITKTAFPGAHVEIRVIAKLRE